MSESKLSKEFKMKVLISNLFKLKENLESVKVCEDVFRTAVYSLFKIQSFAWEILKEYESEEMERNLKQLSG